MAATVSSPWGNKPGAWAQEAEEYDAELQQQQKEQQLTVPAEKLADFPSLSAAATTKTKKKNQKISLAEFYSGEKSNQPTRLTHDESIMLPSGPRQRSEEELERGRLGGGFKSYGGGSRYGSNGDDSSREGRWGSSRVSNRDSPRESNRDLMSSRADEIDNWAAGKKPIGNGNGFGGGFERRDRDRGERGGFFDSQSKADEVDSWVSKKNTNSYAEPLKRFGNSFERKNSFDSLQRDSPRDLDNWGKKREEPGRDLDNWGKKREEIGSPNGAGARPRLVLQPRSVPLSEEAKKESLSPVVAKPKGSNPFGAARPREEVLAEKGQDWKEIDEKLEATKIKEVAPGAEKADRAKSSFGPGSGRAPAEGAWRKSEPEAAAAPPAPAEPQSEENTENGDAAEK